MECQLDKITVHYESFGEGRPVIMLHGMGPDHTMMIYELERYFTNRPNWKRIYIDLPGSGKTQGAEWINSVNQILQVLLEFVDKVIPGQRFVVIGTSYGGYVARGLAYRRGQDMDGLLLNTPHVIWDESKAVLPPKVTLQKDQSLMEQAKSEGITWLEFLAVVQNRSVLEYAKVLENASLNRDKDLYARIEAPRGPGFTFDVDHPAKPFPAPTLIITGRQDNLCGYRDAWNLLENYPRATFALLDKAGHLAAGEQPALSAALINEWLDRVEEYTNDHPVDLAEVSS